MSISNVGSSHASPATPVHAVKPEPAASKPSAHAAAAQSSRAAAVHGKHVDIKV
jgi:hypothetical protein